MAAQFGADQLNYRIRQLALAGQMPHRPPHFAIANACSRTEAARKGIPLFINARTDVYLGNGDDVKEALKRGKAYASAGASGFFVPGVKVPDQIRRLAVETSIPVNVMVMEGVPSNKRLSELRVARISYGPIPYIDAMEAVKKNAQHVHS